MAIIEQNSMPFRPYARLMNILGDQLITDKKVAVIEIIKNSYDADASSVKVRFCNMSNVKFNDLPKEEQAYIEIEDDGSGMSLDIIKNVWLRPATPNKFERKKRKNNKTEKGRIIQGEKGIGRFAIHKLGEKIELYTKAKGQNEVKLEMNFVDFNPDDVNLFNQPTEYKLLDEVSNNWYVQNPPERVTGESGTVIRIKWKKMKRIKEILGEDLSGWTFSLGMVICMIFSIFVQVAVFVCFLITVVWFGFNHIKDRDTDGCLLFLSGAFVAQILIWLM